MRAGYSVFFSKGKIEEDYLEMALLSLSSFFWSNPGKPFFLFLIEGIDESPWERIIKEKHPLHLIPLEESELPEGFSSMNIAPHGFRFNPLLRDRLPSHWEAALFQRAFRKHPWLE